MKRVIHAVVFWITTVFIMYIIFSLSAQNADESRAVSHGLLDIIIQYIGNIISESTLRTFAHFAEYTALGFFLCGSVYCTFDKLKYYINIIPCAIYAVSDEIHQLFVPDRAFQLTDILVDSLGSSLGIILFILIICIYRKKQNNN